MMSNETQQQEVRPVNGKSMYSYIADAWKNPSKSYLKELNHERRILWRREENFLRIDKPTRLDRARALGFKAKQGYVIIRAKVRKGNFRKRAITAGRRAKRKGINQMTVGKSLQRMAEERTAKRYQNLEVLNSYWVGADGQHEWYEVILVDPAHPVIKADPKINWICKTNNKNRVYRGLTSAGAAGRGLRNKGKGAENARPSVRVNKQARGRHN
jgi:large subunit ribosomal protein L15e